MPLSQFDVCDLIHTFSEHRLKLSSKCTISISQNAEDPISSLITELSTPPTVESLWIARGPGLRIAVTLKLADEVTAMDGNGIEVFNEQLGLALQNAEFWPQLGLSASLAVPGDGDVPIQDSGGFYLSIVHVETSENTKTARHDINVASIRPPNGVPHAEIKEIHIIWTLSQTRARPRPRIKRMKPSKPKHSEEVVDDELLLHNDHDGYRALLSLSQPPPQSPSLEDMLTGHVWSSSQPPAASNPDGILDDEWFAEDQTTPDHSPLDSQVMEPQKDQTEVRGKARRKRTGSDLTVKLPDFCISLKLFDASLRYMICDKTIRTSPGIKLSERSHGPKLAEICPGLFSPGYLQAMSERYRFISTIAHAMTSIYGRSTSETLKSTFAQLPIPGPSVISARDGDISQSDLVTALKARLWILAQKQLYDPKAAQQLKPLTLTDTENLASLVGNEMLDSPSSPATLADTFNDTRLPFLCLHEPNSTPTLPETYKDAESPWLCPEEPSSSCPLPSTLNNSESPWLCQDKPFTPPSPWLCLLDELTNIPGGIDENFADDLLDDPFEDGLLDDYNDDQTILGDSSSSDVDLFDELLQHSRDMEMDREMLSLGPRSATGDSMEMLDDERVDAETASMLDDLGVEDEDQGGCNLGTMLPLQGRDEGRAERDLFAFELRR